MADNEKYYYLRLKEDFFDGDAIKLLEAMTDGYLYSNILLKLYLKSLKHDGKLMFNERIPYNAQALATVTRHTVGTVEKALEIFQQFGLIEVLDNGSMYMLDIQNFIGKTSTEADRKRSYRERIEKEKLSISGQMSGQISDKSTPEIEIEKEIKIDIKKKSSHFVPPSIDEVKAYCTERKNNVNPHKFYDYFNTPDAKGRTWIDSKGNKVKNWKQKIITWEQHSGSDNSKKSDQPKQTKFNNHPQRTYTDQDYAELERKLLNKGL